MCSYNEVNGIPACASEDLLGLVRNKWGFEGYGFKELLKFELSLRKHSQK
jgi:hypothetical protein